MNMIFLKDSDQKEFISQFTPMLTSLALLFIEKSEETVCIGIEEDGNAIAAICAHPKGDAMEIVSLYVHEDHRRKKLASDLLEVLFWEAFYKKEVDHISAEYCLLPPETMEALGATFTSKNFHFYETVSGEEIYECDVKDLIEIEKINGEVQSFADVGIGNHEKILHILGESIDTQFTAFPQSTDMDISQVYMKDNNVLALFWVERYEENLLRVAALYNNGDSKLISTVVSASIQKAKAILTPETVIICDLYDGLGKKALTHMTGGKMRPCTRFVHAFAIL